MIVQSRRKLPLGQDILPEKRVRRRVVTRLSREAEDARAPKGMQPSGF